MGKKGGQSAPGEDRAPLAENNQPEAGAISANSFGDRLRVGYRELPCDALVIYVAVRFRSGALRFKSMFRSTQAPYRFLRRTEGTRSRMTLGPGLSGMEQPSRLAANGLRHRGGNRRIR